MKALFIVEPGKTEIREIDPPEAGDGDVLIKVGLVGFCGGDLNAFRGVFPMQRYPMLLGHEIGGTVEAVERDVPEHIRTGMRVTVSPYRRCGRCSACLNGRPNACRDNRTMGVMRPGAMTGYIAAPWTEVYPSAKLTLEELALVEPLTVGFHAAARGRVGEGDTVLVIGCGIVGLGAVSGASSRGARVIAADIDDRKLRLAEKAGAVRTVNPGSEDLHGFLGSVTDGRGPDVVIEAVGRPETYLTAVREVAFTGRVVYIGYAKDPVTYDTRFFVQKELDILGSRNCLGEFPTVIEILEAGKFPAGEAVSRIVPLEQAGAALADWSAAPGGIVKIMVSVG